jgi:hypothetical protein
VTVWQPQDALKFMLCGVLPSRCVLLPFTVSSALQVGAGVPPALAEIRQLVRKQLQAPPELIQVTTALCTAACAVMSCHA